MKNVLVTGANGQLGKCVKDASLRYPNLNFIFTSKEQLDIEDQDFLENFFRNNKTDYCINAAAFTNVEKAESDVKRAFEVNAEAVRNLAGICQNYQTVFIQISTDYVFDGKNKTPYSETDDTNPINVYGESKLKGEKYIIDHCDRYFIFRTSWLYSQYGHNFLNTILKNSKENKPLTITTEQTGTPTNANDLANAILEVIATNSNNYGVYHYSNSGEATWYDFAETILKHTTQLKGYKLGKTRHYRTFAERPIYSVLNLNKYETVFNRECVNWETSLVSLLKKISSNQ